MTTIQILAQGAAAWGKTEGIVTAGAVGIPVTLQCSRNWDGLRKIIKFRCGEVQYQVEVVEGTAITVPWDCLLEGRRLEIALDGWDSAGTLRIPTNWVCCAVVQPSGTQGTEPPAPPAMLTQQLLEWADGVAQKIELLPSAEESTEINRAVNGYVEGFLTRYIKIVFGDVYSSDAVETSVSVAEVNLTDTDGAALTVKAVTADSVLSDTYPADKVLDGNPGSFWISARVSGAEHYLLLELDGPANVGSLGIIPRPDKSYHRIDSFKVLASADGSTWQEVGRFGSLKALWTTGKWKTFPLTPTQHSQSALRDEVQSAKAAAREAGTVPVVEAGGWDYAGLPVTNAPKTAAFADSAPMGSFPKYALLGQNHFPRDVGFNRSFPYNGITLTENGRVMHIDGTASAQATFAVNKDSSPYLTLPEALKPGSTVILRTFLAGETVKNGIYVTLLFYDSSNKQISFKNHFCGENGSDVSTQVTIPANAASFGIWWNVKSPGGETHNADVCAVLYDAGCDIQAGTEAVPRNAAAVSFFPVPASRFSYRASVKDYVDRYAGGENAMTSDALGYLTPEMFGAKGDYATDDAAALNACLQAAAKRNLPARGFKRYKTTAPIVIAGRNMDVDINTIRYAGTDTAVTLEGWWNRVRIGRIYSDGIGLTIQSANDSTVYNQITLNDLISKDAHGIVVANGGNSIFQNQIQFARILGTGKAGTHGITYAGDAGSCAECTFTGGQISGYDYAVKLHSGNHKFYNIHVESNMEGGFWIIGGGCLIYGDRHAESSRDGKYCFLKMTTDNTMHAVDVNGQYTSACRMPVNEIDLSEVCLTEGKESIDNGHYFTLNCPISPGIYYKSNEHKTHYLSDGAKLWGGNIILNPAFKVYRKVTEAVFDNRVNDQKLEPLPTTFEIAAENCQVYLHASYCFMGYSTFEIIQTESFQADFYDWRGTKIFTGADHGAGRFHLEHVITAEDGKGHYDGTGTQWVITKE